MFENLHSTMKKIGAGIGVILIANSYSYAQQWEDVGGVQTVSAGGSSFNNLVIDNSGKYYLSYYDTSVGKGSVQIFNGTSWSYAGGSAGITTGSATYNSLSIDGLGNIYYTNQIGYPGSGMEVRQFNGTSWMQLPNATGTSVNYHASAVSPANVLFTFGNHNSGTVSRYVNGAWEQVGNTGFSSGASFAEMVIGTNNKIYTCNVASGVRVYENNTTATSSDNWSLVGGTIVDAASSSEQYTSDIAIDDANNLYVAYVSNSAGGQKLNVKKFNGTSWVQMGSANFSSGRVQHVALAVAPSGKPYVVASRFENDNLLRNTAYQFNETAQDWETLGGDFISDGQALYNDLIFDKVNNYLVLAYSQSGTKVKRISLTNNNTTPACNNTDPGNNTGDLGCVSFQYLGQQVSYTTVRGADGRVWLQQNLGSSRVATAMNDEESFGDLFQWGRWDDGHQMRNSATSSTPSNNYPDGLTGITSFILGSNSTAWWGVNSLNDQWSAGSSSDVTSSVGADPCKKVGQGWRMPTQAEWGTYTSTEGVSNISGAFASTLKLPGAGYRSPSTGGFTYFGERGYYWSSDPSSSGAKYVYLSAGFGNAAAGGPRGQGQSVRCIKDFTQLGTVDVKLNTVIVGVYPNPTNGILNIKTDSAIDAVAVYSMIGQKLNLQYSNNQINMQELPKGTYIVELKLKNGQKISKKVIKN